MTFVTYCIYRHLGVRQDTNLVLPIRQTASIFKQPVTVVKNRPESKTRADLKHGAQEQPRQVGKCLPQSFPTTIPISACNAGLADLSRNSKYFDFSVLLFMHIKYYYHYEIVQYICT